MHIPFDRYKDGIPLVLNDRSNLSQSGTLTITELNKDTDQGLYTCVASTKSGKSTWSAYLKLEAPTNPNIRFYRAPEASTFPGQPGKLVLLSHSKFWVSGGKIDGVVNILILRFLDGMRL